MAKVKIEIDTESGELNNETLDKGRIFAPEKKVGFLASITPSPDLMTAFALGFNNTLDDSVKAVGKGYNAGNLKNHHGDLLGKNIDFIVTAGGSVTFDAIRDLIVANNVPFMSLLGSEPVATPTGNALFLGGVSLQSFQSNIERLNLLVAKGHALANIYLYCNPNSAMNAKEEQNWNSINPPAVVDGQPKPQIVEFGGADTTNKTNEPAAFATDFNGITPKVPNTATGIVISADPFFQEYKPQLVGAANTWLQASAARYVVYPSLIFSDAGPRQGQSTLYGPDLKSAYRLLGILAQVALASRGRNQVGLYPIGNQRIDVM